MITNNTERCTTNPEIDKKGNKTININRCMYCKEMFDLYCAKAKKNVPMTTKK